MTLHALLSKARRLGIRLEARGTTLRVDAPAGRLTPALRAELNERKPELLAHLSNPVLQVVMLKGGLVLPLPALQFALSLEARECRLMLDANQQVVIEPGDALTVADQARLLRWRWHLATLVVSECRTHELPQ